MRIKIWGARGSIPTPLSPAAVEEKIVQAIMRMPTLNVRDEDAVRTYVHSLPPLLRGTAGGNTTCVEVRSGDDILIIDGGSGLRELGEELMQGPCGRGEGRLHIFFTHLHWDHVQGFPFFRPIYVPGNRITIYGIHDVRDGLEAQQAFRFFPVSLAYMRATTEFVTLQPGEPFTVGNMRIRTLANAHPGVAYSCRVENGRSLFVHASDAEFSRLDPESVEPHIKFFAGADALIFDAQYTLREAWQKADWGHSSALIGLDLARAAGVKRLILFHHDPAYTDEQLREIRATALVYQQQDRSLPTCEVLVAYEGMTLDLAPAGFVDVHKTPDGQMTIVNPARMLSLASVAPLEQELSRWEQAEHSAGSIINLSEVDNLTLAGLNALVRLRQQRPELPMVLVSPDEKVRRVVRLSGCEDYFAIYPSVEAAQAAVRAREALNLPGHILKNRYQIQEQIGQNRATVVLKAHDNARDQLVALKIFDPAVSEATLQRLQQLTRQLMGVDHPHIGRMLRWEQDGDHRFVVEEYVEGPSLQELLEEADGPLPLPETWRVIQQTLRALEYAHSWGVIHAALMPENIILSEKGVKIVDFGLGRMDEDRQLLEVPPLVLNADYAAPEQIVGQLPDARTDLYALGVISYRMLAGRMPFLGNTEERLTAHLNDDPPPLRDLNPAVTPTVAHLVHKLLAKNPNNRYAAAQQVLQIGQGLLAGHDVFPRRRHLIGRQERLAALLDIWQIARQGTGQLVFISGEPGIGKSSLAQELAVRSEAPVVLQGRCREGEPAGYHLFTEVLRAHLATLPPELFDTDIHPLLSSFAHLVPEIYRAVPELPPQPVLEPEQEHLRLMASLNEFIRRATGRRPWLLILEDLQWADVSSMELFRYLARHLPEMSLLIVCTYRDTEIDSSHLLQETLRSLSSSPGYGHFRLERLSVESVHELLQEIYQTNVPRDLAEKLYRHTEGNPFYVQELATELLEAGLILRQDGELRYPALEQIDLPPSVHEAVWRRISHLQTEIQNLLHRAAVLGHTFRFDHLLAMSGLPERQVLEYLDVALERQLVHEVSHEPLLSFRHAEIQRVLYADMGTLRRRILHRQAGEVLEKHASQPEELAADLAYHFAAAGEDEKALYYTLEAARRAQATYANDQALTWYARVLEQLDRGVLADAAERDWKRFAAHKGMAEVLTLIGRHNEALEHAHQARELYARKSLNQGQSRQMAGLCRLLAEIFERRNEYDTAFEWLRQGTKHLEGDESSEELVRILTMCGWIMMRQGDYEGARQPLRRALKLSRKLHLPAVEASCLRHLGVAAWYKEDYQRAGNYWEKALAICEQNRDRIGKGVVLNNLGLMATDVGRYDDSRRYLEEALEYIRESGHRWRESQVLNNLGNVYKQLGDFRQAQLYLQEGLEICRSLGDRQCASLVQDNLGYLYCELQDFERARESCEQALQLAEEVQDRRRMASALVCAAHAYAALDRPDDAIAAYQQAITLREGFSQPHLQVEARAGLACVLQERGNTTEALAQVEQVLEVIAGQPELSGNRNPVWVYLACYDVLRATGDPRAGRVLRQTYHLMQTLAARIEDEQLRHSFLTNVPANRRCQALLQGEMAGDY